MKQKIQRSSIILLALFLTFGCSLLNKSTYNFTFQNNSSFSVLVQAAGDDNWSGFTLNVGDSKTIKTENDPISFRFSPGDKVTSTSTSYYNIVFSNK